MQHCCEHKKLLLPFGHSKKSELGNVIKQNRNIQPVWMPLQAFMVILLFIFYTVGFLQFDSVHALIHNDEGIVLHSVQHELDPCHRSLYHRQAGDGCNHKSHVTENKQCSLCGITFHNEVTLSLSETTIDKKIIAIRTAFCWSVPEEESLSHHPPRGPPIA